MKKLIALLLLALPIAGCNTTGNTLSGTGFWAQLGPVQLVGGNFDVTSTAGEFADEQIIIEHTNFYDANANLSGDSTIGITQGVKSSYRVRVTPVKPAIKPDATPVVPEEPDAPE